MKKLLLMTGLLSFTFSILTQAQNWKTNGNTIVNGDYLGTDNNEPLIFKANGNEGLRIKPNGELRIKNFDDNLYTGLIFVNTNGILSKLNFSGNANEVLLGNGTFGNISLTSGWSFAGGIASTTGKVVIGNISSTEKLNVDGNILANGSISGTSINVVDIVGAGKEIKIMNSLCLKGQDVNIPGSRNMICGMNGDLYVQSTNSNYNTILNFGNAGKVGIGVIPTEDFHVGKSARFEAEVNFAGISSSSNLNDLLMIDSDGKIIRGGPGLLAAELWDLTDCLQDINGNMISTWHAGFGKITTGTATCEGDTKVGINVLNPLHNLHNNGTTFLKGVTGIGGNPNGHNVWLYIQSDNSDDAIRFNNSSGTQFKVDGTGKVVARDIKVTLNAIPDYVFKAEYKLPTLTEQENYIKTNGHLLGVPSELEMVQNETTIGELEMINLKLNEEQMLYLIELTKRIDCIEKENARLNAVVKELSNQKK